MSFPRKVKIGNHQYGKCVGIVERRSVFFSRMNASSLKIENPRSRRSGRDIENFRINAINWSILFEATLRWDPDNSYGFRSRSHRPWNASKEVIEQKIWLYNRLWNNRIIIGVSVCRAQDIWTREYRSIESASENHSQEKKTDGVRA